MTVSTWVIVGLGLAVVLLASLLKNVGWSDKVKQFLVVVLSVVAGAVTVWQTGGFDNATDVLQTATLIYGASQLIYAFIFKGTGFESTLAEVKVLPGPAVVDTQANSDEVPGA